MRRILRALGATDAIGEHSGDHYFAFDFSRAFMTAQGVIGARVM